MKFTYALAVAAALAGASVFTGCEKKEAAPTDKAAQAVKDKKAEAGKEANKAADAAKETKKTADAAKK